jgi:hypothetical protein
VTADIGELDCTGGPGEDRRSEVPLEPFDLLGDRRLRQVEPLRCSAEMTLLRDDQERSQSTKIIHASTLSISLNQVLDMHQFAS